MGQTELSRPKHFEGRMGKTATSHDEWMNAGYMVIVDRKREDSSLRRLQCLPREVDDALTDCPGVKMAAVLGLRTILGRNGTADKRSRAARPRVSWNPIISKEGTRHHRSVKAGRARFSHAEALKCYASLPLTSRGRSTRSGSTKLRLHPAGCRLMGGSRRAAFGLNPAKTFFFGQVGGNPRTLCLDDFRMTLELKTGQMQHGLSEASGDQGQ